MAISINNSLINARPYSIEVNLADSKKVKFADMSSDSAIVEGRFTDNLVNGLDLTSLYDISVLDKTVPELKVPKNIQLKNEKLQLLANELESVISNIDETSVITDNKKAQKSDYTKINESAFAALYAKLLELFAAINVTSASLTAIHAGLAEKLAKSSSDHLISGATAQKTQAIVSAVTTMSVGGAGLALSVKGINQQQKAVKQSIVSSELNTVNNSLNNSITNRSNVNNTVAASSGERAGGAILNNNSIINSSNYMESELLRLAGHKNANTGHIIGTMGHGVGSMVASGYIVESATDNATSQLANVAKENMVEAEVKNRDGKNTARNTLKAILDLIYQSMEKNNEASAHVAQMIKA